MLRFLLRRLPRFGFLTLFAAMLLFVSGAGWLKFHYDLYREEEALLADLAKAGCDVGFARFGDMPRSTPPREPPWYRLPAPFRRIQSLDIAYPRLDDRPLIERAATLPSVENFDARYIPPTRPAGPPIPLGGAPSFFDGVDVRLPQLADTPLPDVEQALPKGDALSEDEVVAAIEAWRSAWSKPKRLPRTGVVYSESTGARHPDNRAAIQVRGRDGSLEAIGKDLSLGNRRKISLIRREAEGLRELGRILDRLTVGYHVDDPDSRWLESSTGRRKLETASIRIRTPVRFYDLRSGFDRSAIESIQRIPEGLLRIDFRPTTNAFPSQGMEDRAWFSILLRPDRDFAVEAYDIRVERTDAASPEPIVWTSRFRSVSSDHAGAYLLDAYSVEDLSANGFPFASAPSYIMRSWSSRIAYDFDTAPPAALFEPATYGAIEFPPPRPLPVWRWYRATFVLNVALLGFIALRKLARRFRKGTRALPSFGSRVDEALPVDA